MGWLALAGFVAGVIGLLVHQAQRRASELAERRAGLVARFGETYAVRIIEQEIWTGETLEMLLESLGPPADVDRKVMKTKTKDVYKYRQIAANRYALRVTLEDDVVIGWEIKG